MKRTFPKLLTSLVVLLVPMTITAAELLQEHAKVLSSEPIIETKIISRRADSCLGAKPVSRNLVKIIEWDLGTGSCSIEETHEILSGYQVLYEWDNQQFSFIAAEPPGSHVPIRITIN